MHLFLEPALKEILERRWAGKPEVCDHDLRPLLDGELHVVQQLGVIVVHGHAAVIKKEITSNELLSTTIRVLLSLEGADPEKKRIRVVYEYYNM